MREANCLAALRTRGPVLQHSKNFVRLPTLAGQLSAMGLAEILVQSCLRRASLGSGVSAREMMTLDAGFDVRFDDVWSSSTTVTRPVIEERVELAPRYNLVLLDDDDHSYEYVIVMLARLFGFGVEKAYACAREVDKTGRVILMTGSFEHCELKQDQIHSYGPDPGIARCAGSMTALVERVD